MRNSPQGHNEVASSEDGAANSRLAVGGTSNHEVEKSQKAWKDPWGKPGKKLGADAKKQGLDLATSKAGKESMMEFNSSKTIQPQLNTFSVFQYNGFQAHLWNML